MAEPKTISNLPIDVSIRWSEDQRVLEEIKPMIQEAGLIPQYATTEVILPASQLQLDTLIGTMGRYPTFALFQKPVGYQQRRLFGTQLVSFLGSDEQQDGLIARIQGISGDEEDKDSWQGEKTLLLQLLQLMKGLNKDLIDILSRCKQYQKG